MITAEREGEYGTNDHTGLPQTTLIKKSTAEETLQCF